MLNSLISYLASVRSIEKNMRAARGFAAADRRLMAEDLYRNQLMIDAVENTVIEGGDADNEQIIKVLSEGGRSATRMWRNVGAGGRRDPASNMASTVEGLFFETAMSRRLPSHRGFVVRINKAITTFVEENLSEPERLQINREIRGQVKALHESLGASTPE
jgi:hypothetical protein